MQENTTNNWTINYTEIVTKASIVQKLLDSKQVTSEEAVILLKESNVNYYYPQLPVYSPSPWLPNIIY